VPFSALFFFFFSCEQIFYNLFFHSFPRFKHI